MSLAAPSPEDLAEVDAIAALLPRDLAYARLDLLRYQGRLCIIELELIEPVLYMKLVPESVGCLADAVLA